MRMLASTCLLAVLLTPLPASAGEPTASPSPRPGCGAPAYKSITAQPPAVSPGETVTVTIVVRDEPCYPDEQVRHDVSLFATREPYRDPAPLATGTTDSSGRFVYVDQPWTSTTYYMGTRDTQTRGGPTSARVTVDRVGGSCAGVVSLEPANGQAGRTVRIVGSAPSLEGDFSDTGTVTIMTRRRNTTVFAEHDRTRVPWDAGGRFYSSLVLDEDYRMYASTRRCDSPQVLAFVRPTIAGPPAADRGTSVALAVTGLAGVPVLVRFRKRGASNFVTRRWGVTDAAGHFATAFSPDDDYRYYALVGHDRRESNAGITQLRR